MINLLQSLGSKIKFNKNKLIIDNSKQKKNFASYSLVKTMRAGILVLGPLLAKFGKQKYPYQVVVQLVQDLLIFI